MGRLEPCPGDPAMVNVYQVTKDSVKISVLFNNDIEYLLLREDLERLGLKIHFDNYIQSAKIWFDNINDLNLVKMLGILVPIKNRVNGFRYAKQS